VPWSNIIDRRSDEPAVHRAPRRSGEAYGEFFAGISVPDDIDVTPTPALENFGAEQLFALALFSEKSVMSDDLPVLAQRYGGNSYIGGGDQVDRRVWEMARDAARDGRKLILFTVCDCDPGGWHMPIVIARKLQAFAVGEFPGLEFAVVRVGLTPEQVQALNLPSSPLKPTEARADRWHEMMGVEQTELDAAMALKHNAFIAAIEKKILLYFDETLAGRVAAAAREWEEEAEEAVAEMIGEEEIAELQDRYDRARGEIETVNLRLNEIADQVRLPDPPVPPETEMDGKEALRAPLIDSDWGFVEGTLRLNASKAYEIEEDEG
jgi:hypothetical protein